MGVVPGRSPEETRLPGAKALRCRIASELGAVECKGLEEDVKGSWNRP